MRSDSLEFYSGHKNRRNSSKKLGWDMHVNLGFHHIDKHDFLQAYPEARDKVFNIQNAQSGFRATGIVPYDPTEVLKRFNYSISTPIPPGSRGGASTSSSTLATPHTVRQLHKKASFIKEDAF
jgi:hypothetical protein